MEHAELAVRAMERVLAADEPGALALLEIATARSLVTTSEGRELLAWSVVGGVPRAVEALLALGVTADLNAHYRMGAPRASRGRSSRSPGSAAKGVRPSRSSVTVRACMGTGPTSPSISGSSRRSPPMRS